MAWWERWRDGLDGVRGCEGCPGRHTLDDEIRSENTHGTDTDAGLGCAVGGAEAGEDDGGGAAHGTEEGLRSRVSYHVLPGSSVGVGFEQGMLL
jgi:hypothetical protein